MRIAYFDCFSGAAGDMILAALLDAGCPLGPLQQAVQALNLPGVTLRAEKVKRGGIAATHVRVDVGAEAQEKHRHLHHITAMIDAARLAPPVADAAKRVFQRLAAAEAQVHATTIEKVHFHEVGAADAIVDIVCACAALHELRIEAVHCSAVPTGHGTVRCEHGIMPVPAPATANLLAGVPLAACDEPGELTTPTGAAILTTLSRSFGPPPEMTIRAIGYGAGTREGRTRPNVLRVLVADSAAAVADEQDVVVVLEAQVDDAPGQVVGHAVERALSEGALDAYIVPIIMKKGRPGQLLSVLCSPADADKMEDVLFRETTTFGVRRATLARHKLAREHVSVQTPFGAIRVKVGRRGGAVVQAWPEYEDCAAAAQRSGAALRDVQRAALAAYGQSHGCDAGGA